MPRTALVWFRRALRFADQPALAAALAFSDAVVPVALPGSGTRPSPGATSRAWEARSLAALDRSLQARGARLVVREGNPAEAILALCAESGATVVYTDRAHEPQRTAADHAIAEVLARVGVAFSATECALLGDPDGPRTASGGPYTVFTPFAAARLRTLDPHVPTEAPARLPVPETLPAGTAADALPARAPAPPPRMLERFTPGEDGALAAAARFFAEAADEYAEGRERPDVAGTSRLSPHLAFGEISPHRLMALAAEHGEGGASFARQLLWREFGAHLLRHHPETVDRPLRPAFEAFPWTDDPAGLDAWREGRTGYPLVDAGMRELAATGWMHNRVRMVAASFLTKDLLVPWTEGAAHFWELLADADLGNNTLGWQWVAGSGADAAPYFRVFNPVSQGERYDPHGVYVRAWVPELAGLPDRWVHRPWEAPREVLEAAEVTPGVTYPERIIEHAGARERALAAYASIRG